jgi:cell division transport system permease protein
MLMAAQSGTYAQQLAALSKKMAKGRRYDLPLHRGSGGQLVVWTVGVMTYLCILAFILIFGLNHLQQNWQSGLTGHMTVEIPYDTARSINDATLRGLVANLNKLPHVTARLLTLDDLTRLVGPWLGDRAVLSDLPLPKLVDITRDSDENAASLDAIRAAATRAVPSATLDTHEDWLADLLKLAEACRMILVGVAFILAVTTALTVAGTARTRLALHREEVDLLHLIGATDTYIASQFQRQAFRLATEGAAAGLALAFITLIIVGWIKGDLGDALVPQLNLTAVEWMFIVTSPLLAGAIAMAASRYTVLAALKEMP